jgi:hypothetical protein
MKGGPALFKRYMDRFGVSWEKLLSSGLSFFISEQDPEKVVFKVHTDNEDRITGYSIQVKTDEDNVREAKEFWEEHVEGKLRG